MSRLKLYGRGRELVWEGEAEVYTTHNSAWSRDDLVIERHEGDRHQRINFGTLVEPDMVSWTVSAPVTRIVSVAATPEDPARLPDIVAAIEHEWTVDVDLPAGALAFLGRALREPIRTRDEQDRLGEMRHRAHRTLDPNDISQAEVAGAIDADEAARLRLYYLAARPFGAPSPGEFIRIPRIDMQTMRERMEAASEQLAEVRRRMSEAVIPAAEALAALGRSEAGPDQVIVEESGAVIDAAVSRSAEHDRIIEEARASFPADPHRYDYPKSNEMRWSPPPEGEKVPSCPA